MNSAERSGAGRMLRSTSAIPSSEPYPIAVSMPSPPATSQAFTPRSPACPQQVPSETAGMEWPSLSSTRVLETGALYWTSILGLALAWALLAKESKPSTRCHEDHIAPIQLLFAITRPIISAQN